MNASPKQHFPKVPDEISDRLNAEADELAGDEKALIKDVSANVVRMMKRLEYLAFNPPDSRSGALVQRGAIKDYIELAEKVVAIAKARGLLKEEE